MSYGLRACRGRFWAALALAVPVVGAQPQLVVPLEPPRPMPSVASVTDAPNTTEQEVRAFFGPRAQGVALKRAVAKVAKQLTWHPTLDAALAKAEATGKPVVWIQALGTLNGFL